MNPDDIQVAGPVFSFWVSVSRWSNPLVHGAGLVVAIWAFFRLRKWGYFIVGLYFALALFALLALPAINRAIEARQKPNVPEQVQAKIDIAVQQAIERVQKQEGHPMIAHRQNVNIPFGPILLVVGLWLIAKQDLLQGLPNNRTELPNANDMPVN